MARPVNRRRPHVGSTTGGGIVDANASHDASVGSADDIARDNMHTAVERSGGEEEIGIGINWLREALSNADDKINQDHVQEEDIPMTTDAATGVNASASATYSDPDPRRNSLMSRVHITNMAMRLEAENAILTAQIHEIDRKIAELQAERTDMTGAIAMNNAALNVGESL